MKMRFHIPDFTYHGELNLNMIDLLKEHPEYFYDDIEIASCFGCFPSSLWNGGRAFGGNLAIKQMIDIIKAFNSRNVPLRFTFTNPTITKDDLDDVNCNNICKLGHNGYNEAICFSPELEEYVRATYPKYPIISTTCKEIRDIDGLIAELEKDYKLVVLDYNWNNDFEKLAQIPEQYRERCEILINPYCTPNCPRRGEHYRQLGMLQRAMCEIPGLDPNKTNVMKCANSNYNFYQVSEYSTFVPRENLTKYMELGFNNFKIEGRAISAVNVIESYMYYMVKPEYRDKIRLDWLTRPYKLLMFGDRPKQ